MTKQDTQKRIYLTKRVIYKKSAPVPPHPIVRIFPLRWDGDHHLSVTSKNQSKCRCKDKNPGLGNSWTPVLTVPITTSDSGQVILPFYVCVFGLPRWLNG